MKFSIGYNFDTKLLDALDCYQGNLEGFYFPIPRSYLGSGRDIQEPKDYSKQIEKIIKKCRLMNITSQLLLNATYEGKEGLGESFFTHILKYIQHLRSLGLQSVVVTNPLYIPRIKSEIKDIRIESSVNCYVKTPEHALYLKDLGVEVITIDRDINRNIALIGEIKRKTGLKIRMMLNEGCVSNCPYRVLHYNYLSEGKKSLSKKIMRGVFLDKFCFDIYMKDPLKIFHVPFVPPEAVKFYQNCVDYYKLSTRVFPTWRIKLCLDAYIKGRFTGNLLWLLDSPGISYFKYVDYRELLKKKFFKMMSECELNCAECGYCAELFKKAVLIERSLSNDINLREEKKVIRLYVSNLKQAAYPEDMLISNLHLGEAYLNLGKYKKAIQAIQAALRLNCKANKAYLILGLAYLGLKNHDLAVQALKKEPLKSPYYNKARLAILRCYKNAGGRGLIYREIRRIKTRIRH